MVVKRGAIAGALIAAPKIIDAFLVPPAYALMYTGIVVLLESWTEGEREGILRAWLHWVAVC
jgi:hypothetical protein